MHLLANCLKQQNLILVSSNAIYHTYKVISRDFGIIWGRNGHLVGYKVMFYEILLISIFIGRSKRAVKRITNSITRLKFGSKEVFIYRSTCLINCSKFGSNEPLSELRIEVRIYRLAMPHFSKIRHNLYIYSFNNDGSQDRLSTSHQNSEIIV